MPKISLLSGAYKNAGDFLIENRARNLILHNYPNCEIHKFLRNEVSSKFDEINSSDVIVFTGGPIYQKQIENHMDVDTCLKFTKPLMIIGGGWRGMTDSSREPYSYKFSSKSVDFLAKVQDGIGLGCRDLFSVKALKKEGLKNVVMTGCPAWYSIPHVNGIELKSNEQIKTIMISDPAVSYNYNLVLPLVNYLQEKFKGAQITFVFHRGIEKSDRNVSKMLNQLRNTTVRIVDISNSIDGFSMYDSCDLHIGFRVHAHIYNLSIRNRSILIEEDGRGAGVDEALGLPSITAHRNNYFTSKIKLRKYLHNYNLYCNNYILHDLDTYINSLIDTDYQYLRNAYSMQKSYFNIMCDFIRRI